MVAFYRFHYFHSYFTFFIRSMKKYFLNYSLIIITTYIHSTDYLIFFISLVNNLSFNAQDLAVSDQLSPGSRILIGQKLKAK